MELLPFLRQKAYCPFSKNKKLWLLENISWVGDQVMVGFVHNHPDRPFVMGGMFHGQVGLSGGADNRVKSIQTRSGHKVI